MGAGKTTIGRLLAKHFARPFVDSDHEIEARTGVKVPVIFEIEGESGFRQRESQVIAELTQRHGIVLATGGGAVLAENNCQLLREHGVVVYLHAPLEALLKRTHKDRNRPLLQTEDPRHTLEEILKAREPIYRQSAAIVIDTAHRSPLTVAREIVKKLEALPSEIPD